MNGTDGRGDNPFAECCNRGMVEMAHLLLDYNADANTVAKDGYPALHRVVQQGEVSLFRVMLSKGADVDIVNTRNSWTRLQEACEHGRVSIVKLILAHKCEVNTHDSEHGQTPLIRAGSKGHTAIATTLLDDDGTKINATDRYNKTALYHAVCENNAEIVDILLGRSADPSIEGVEDRGRVRYTPLCQAVRGHHDYTIVERLLQAGAEVDRSHFWRTPLSEASHAGQVATSRLLLQYSAKVDAREPDLNYTPLNMAAIQGHWSITRLLLEEGKADVDASNRGNMTSLHEACKHGHVEVARLLLAKGANPSSRNM